MWPNCFGSWFATYDPSGRLVRTVEHVDDPGECDAFSWGSAPELDGCGPTFISEGCLLRNPEPGTGWVPGAPIDEPPEPDDGGCLGTGACMQAGVHLDVAVYVDGCQPYTVLREPDGTLRGWYASEGVGWEGENLTWCVSRAELTLEGDCGFAP